LKIKQRKSENFEKVKKPVAENFRAAFLHYFLV